jgi:hypothetical protein
MCQKNLNKTVLPAKVRRFYFGRSGCGEINDDDPDGIPYTEECSDCDGEGMLYVSID